jgi:hypothetical protein
MSVLRSLTANPSLRGPPFVISSESVDDVVSFARGMQARVVRLGVPPEPDRRIVLRMLGQRAIGMSVRVGSREPHSGGWSAKIGVLTHGRTLQS